MGFGKLEPDVRLFYFDASLFFTMNDPERGEALQPSRMEKAETVHTRIAAEKY